MLVKLGHVVICSVETVCLADGHYVDPTPRSVAACEGRRVLTLLHIRGPVNVFEKTE